MMERLLPRTVNNDYAGHPLALWLFIPITLMTITRSLLHVFLPDGGAQSIATIPLNQYSPGGAGGIVSLFALWGLSQLLLGAVFGVALWRYRSLLPLMYVLFVAEWSGRFLLALWKPVETSAQAPGGVGNLVFPILGVALLILSTRSHRTEAVEDSAHR